MFYAFVFLFMPYPRRVPRFMRFEYLWFYDAVEARVIAWHKDQAEKLDPGFNVQQAGLRVIQARERAREAGIGPMDANYPDLQDYLKRPEK